MYEYLQKLFGSPQEGEQPKAMTFEELSAAIKADKKLKLVNLADGGYVAQNLFDAQKLELDGVKEQLSAANSTIQSYKDMKPEELATAVENWEQKYNTDTQALKDQLSAQARKHAEDMLLSGYKFTSKAARNGIAAELRAKKFQLSDTGELIGGADFIKGLMSQDDYKGAFAKDESQQQQQQKNPRFAGQTGNIGTPPGGSTNPFGNLGFTRLRQPKSNN